MEACSAARVTSIAVRYNIVVLVSGTGLYVRPIAGASLAARTRSLRGFSCGTHFPADHVLSSHAALLPDAAPASRLRDVGPP